jgi:L-threonylcarbamoyladenylate synthase
MRTQRLTTSPSDLDRAGRLLAGGGLVAIPTETVYGLAVRIDDPEAIARLYAAKGRPSDNPLIVHVANLAGLEKVAREVTPLARRLLERFAPGPLTVVLTARDDLSRAVTAGLGTVAVRIPDHPVALALLERCGVPLAAPSANRSARPSPTTAAHVLADLDGAIDAVVDAGPTRVGLESTVVDVRGDDWRILREGGVTREQLIAVLGDGDATAQAPDRGSGDAAGPDTRSPGTRHRHYAPDLEVHIAPAGRGSLVAAALAAGSATRGDDETVGLVTTSGADPSRGGPGVVRLAHVQNAAELAAGLFALFRQAEALGLSALVVEEVPETGIGRAVMDRLRRAAAATGGSATAGSAAL